MVLRKLALAGLLIGAMSIAPQSAASAETLVGTDIESRIIVGLTADTTAVQDMLPEGWTAVAFPSGPLKGANLLVSFVDGHVRLDAEGKPLAPASRRAVTLVSLAKATEGEAFRLFVTGIYTTDPENDPYGLNTGAEISRASALGGPADGGRDSSEAWSVAPATGGALALDLTFTTGRRGWSQSEALSFSAANPDFHHIYRYDNIVDVVASSAMGKPLDGSASLTSSIPELAGVFNGEEQIAAVLDVPVRVRKSYVP